MKKMIKKVFVEPEVDQGHFLLKCSDFNLGLLAESPVIWKFSPTEIEVQINSLHEENDKCDKWNNGPLPSVSKR